MLGVKYTGQSTYVCGVWNQCDELYSIKSHNLFPAHVVLIEVILLPAINVKISLISHIFKKMELFWLI